MLGQLELLIQSRWRSKRAASDRCRGRASCYEPRSMAPNAVPMEESRTSPTLRMPSKSPPPFFLARPSRRARPPRWSACTRGWHRARLPVMTMSTTAPVARSASNDSTRSAQTRSQSSVVLIRLALRSAGETRRPRGKRHQHERMAHPEAQRSLERPTQKTIGQRSELKVRLGKCRVIGR